MASMRTGIHHSKQSSQRKVRLGLIAFSLTLLIPCLILYFRTQGKLEIESFLRRRASAEDLLDRIDSNIVNLLKIEEQRAFEEYAHINLAGGTPRLSPLAKPTDIPGLIGYFQIDPDDGFRTPYKPIPSELELVKQLKLPRQASPEALSKIDRIYALLQTPTFIPEEIKGDLANLYLKPSFLKPEVSSLFSLSRSSSYQKDEESWEEDYFGQESNSRVRQQQSTRQQIEDLNLDNSLEQSPLVQSKVSKRSLPRQTKELSSSRASRGIVFNVLAPEVEEAEMQNIEIQNENISDAEAGLKRDQKKQDYQALISKNTSYDQQDSEQKS
ncbi:MAG: hypothetical protein HQL32_17485, partial [Planctomycetes bacterium]|nr:hypothetical protein [Planctomycetota bacterium]